MADTGAARRGALADARGAPRLARTALGLLPLQVVFRGAEAVWPLLLAAWFGRSPATDLFFLVSAIYVFAGALLAGAFQDSALTPVLVELQREAPGEVPPVAGAVLGHTLVVAAAVALLTAAMAGGSFALSMRHGPLLRLALWLVVAFSAYLVAVAVRGFHVGLLHAYGRYTAHPIASGAGMTVTIGAVALGHDRFGVGLVPAALVAGELVALLVLVPWVRRGLALAVVPSLARPEPVRRLFSLLGYEVVGNTITRVNPLVDQLVAGLSPLVGARTVLRFAADVASVPNSILQATLFPALLSRLSIEAVASRDRLAVTVRRALVGVCSLLAVASGLAIAFRRPLLRLLFLHGSMDAAGVAHMAEIAPYALAGVPSFGALLVLARAHVALQNGRIMLPVGIANAVLNAVLDLALYPVLGLAGILLATSLVHTAIAVALGVAIGRLLARPEVTMLERSG